MGRIADGDPIPQTLAGTNSAGLAGVKGLPFTPFPDRTPGDTRRSAPGLNGFLHGKGLWPAKR